MTSTCHTSSMLSIPNNNFTVKSYAYKHSYFSCLSLHLGESYFSSYGNGRKIGYRSTRYWEHQASVSAGPALQLPTPSCLLQPAPLPHRRLVTTSTVFSVAKQYLNSSPWWVFLTFYFLADLRTDRKYGGDLEVSEKCKPVIQLRYWVCWINQNQ